MEQEFNKVGLYNHNAESYRKVRDAYQRGERIVVIVHATGTGKSYNALQLMYDNPEKKTIYVVPKNSISEHIKDLMEENPNLDIERDFPNVEFRTYQSFIKMTDEELKNISFDLLIIDEFHHLFGPVWEKKIRYLVEHNPEAWVFGMTAYTVVGRGTSYERDMVLSGGDELFSDKIVSRYDLVDAMIDGVLPIPIYRSTYLSLMNLAESLEEKVLAEIANKEEQMQYLSILRDAKRRIHEASGVKNLIQNYIQKGDKCIYFCPIGSTIGMNDINTIMKEMKKYFLEYMNEDDIIFYKTTSEDNEVGKINRNAFYHDLDLDGNSVDGKLRIMFAINQYNEGVHAPNVNKVILGRATTSDIVFFEHIGRCLAVGGSYKILYEKYLEYSWDELIELAKKMNVRILDGMSKEDLIEKLVSPMVLDLTGNIEFIRELENNLKDRIKEQNCKKIGRKKITNIEEVSFDIDILDQDLFLILSDLKSRLFPLTLEQKIVEYIEFMNLGYFPRYRDDNKYFSDGSPVSMFWERKKDKIEYELKNNSNYIEGYDVAKKILQDKILDKTAEFIELLNQGYKPKSVEKEKKFSNGSFIGQYWHHQSSRQNVKSELETNPKYRVGYDLAKAMIEEVEKDKYFERIKEYIELLNQIPEFYPKNNEYEVKFSDGSVIGGFWQRKKNRDNIINELDNNEAYKEGYDVVKQKINDKKIDKLAERILEYIEMLNRGYRPRGHETVEKFSDGSVVGNFWRNKTKIKIELETNPKYRVGYDFAKRIIQEKLLEKSPNRIIRDESIDVIGEYIEKLNQGYVPVAKELKETFSDGNVIGQLWHHKKTEIKTELETNPKYEHGYELARETVRTYFLEIEKRVNKKLVKKLCLENGIDVVKYKSILSKSYDEVYSKMCYLNDCGTLVVSDGILNAIFFMSDVNMQVEYGISLDDLIKRYVKKNVKKGM